MPFTDGHITVKQIDEKTWELVKALEYEGAREKFVVPAGFLTDFASVPRIFQWLLPTYGVYTKSAILHDYLIDLPGISKADADGIFRRSMHELGVPFLRRWIMWAAVRFNSGLAGAKLKDVFLWFLVAVPSILFLFIPAISVILWLFVFYLLEWAVCLVLCLFSRKHVNRPPFGLKRG